MQNVILVDEERKKEEFKAPLDPTEIESKTGKPSTITLMDFVFLEENFEHGSLVSKKGFMYNLLFIRWTGGQLGEYDDTYQIHGCNCIAH